MPPKARITKAMVTDAAFEVARIHGLENVNARTVSQRLGCSTQPVMYHFARIEDMKRAAYERADRFHTEYIMHTDTGQNVMLGIGLNYIRFAVEEPNLFRFLFQSGFTLENSVPQMIDSPELEPVLSAMQSGMGLNRERTKAVFLTLAMFAHGYASILNNNGLEFDEEVVKAHLISTYRGAILAAKENEE